MNRNIFRTILLVALLVVATWIGWYWGRGGAELEEEIELADDNEEAEVADENGSVPQIVDKEISEETERYKIEISYPYITGHPGISTEIQRFAEAKAGEFKEVIAEMPVTAFQAELLVKYEEKLLTEEIASIFFSAYSYTGGAHGLESPEGVNYDLLRNEEITINHVFKDDSGYLEFLSREARNRFRESLGSGFFEQGAGPLKENFESFTLGESSITFYFEPYQVAAYAAGTQELEIPLSGLEKYLADEFKELYN